MKCIISGKDTNGLTRNFPVHRDHREEFNKRYKLGEFKPLMAVMKNFKTIMHFVNRAEFKAEQERKRKFKELFVRNYGKINDVKEALSENGDNIVSEQELNK